MLGRPLLRFEEKVSDGPIKELMIGDECAANRAMLEVTYPVENGQVWLPVLAGPVSLVLMALVIRVCAITSFLPLILCCLYNFLGQVRNWADMDHLWRYTFDEKMKINCADHKVCSWLPS